MYLRVLSKFRPLRSPPNKNLTKDQPKHFGPLNEKEGDFVASLKDSLIGPPGLALPESSGLYTLDTGACDKQVGFVLLQE